MTPARLQRIEEIFYAALDQEPDQIKAFLDITCEGDELLRRKVEALLASRGQAGSFIETSAAGIATRIIGNGRADLLVGQTFGHYKISKGIGSGGMGEVYLATDVTAGRKAALKLLPARFTGDAERLRRFRQEARAVVALNHPNILTVYEIGEDHSTHYIASELIEGETLRQRLTRGRMELSEAVDIASQVASALAAAHEAGIVHRDISPGNIMLRPDGYVKVLDFGIAKLAEQEAPARMPKDEALLLVETNLGSILGTVPYMSPEQACGAPVDKRTDIWSLGLVLYEMVTGHAPFTGDTPSEVMTSILKKEPLPLGSYVRHSPNELQQIINKTLRKDRTERHQDARELLEALKSLRRKLEFAAELERSPAARSLLRPRRSLAAAVLILLIAALALALPFYWYRNLTTVTSLRDKSIAVLPFENTSKDPNAEYLSEGISEALINSLTELQRLRVIARSTAFQYKGKDVDPRRVGRELQVGAVLTGRVRQSQDALSIQVDLMDAVTGAQLWGEEYRRKISDVIAVKQAIAREVTAKLKLKLTGDEQRRLVKGDTTNTEAYRFYLRGRYFWNKRTPDGIKQAIAEFQQAIERDPQFPLGYVGLADCYTGLTFYNFAAPHEAMPKAKESAIKALSLDNTVAEAHASLAHVLMNYDWDWPTAEKEFKRSIELKPDYATAHQWYAIHYLTATSRLEEAIQEMKRALELEPASLVMNTFMGATFCYADRYDEAIDQCRRTVEMDPNFAVAHWHLGLAYEQKQLLDAAIEEFKKAISLSGGSPLMKAALGRAYAKSQKKHEANEMLNELNQLAKRQYVSAYEIATIYVALGNNEQAFQLLEQAYREHSFHLVNLNVSPQFKSVRSDPRFQDLVQRVGLSKSASNPVPPEKSIAMLPFENLSTDPENTFFAEGIQEEILARLAKIVELKVISRTSTREYQSKPGNLSEIARQLGVGNILKGSVQKAGDHVRVNVQLINAATGSQLWADSYDRKLTDIFGVESEIAKGIAESLQAKLTRREEQAVAMKPTSNPEAYDAYLRGLAFDLRTFSPVEKAIGLYEKAVQLDPTFALAWARLCRAHAFSHFDQGYTTATSDAAKRALDNAQKLQPDSPDTLLALAYYQYWVLRDYELAKTTFKRISKMLPSSSEVLVGLAFICRRQGQWDESITYLEQALVVDPRNTELLENGAYTYKMLRQFPAALKLYDRALDIRPNDPDLMASKASAYQAQGNLEEAAKWLPEVNVQTSSNTVFSINNVQLALKRNLDRAIRLLQARQAQFHFESEFEKAGGQVTLALNQRLVGDNTGEKGNAEQARNTLDLLCKSQPGNFRYAKGLSRAYAVLGDKDAALREAERATRLLPSDKDAVIGPSLEENLAIIEMINGENSRAISILARLLATPYEGDRYLMPITPVLLRLDPVWDALRLDPAFQKLCEEKPH